MQVQRKFDYDTVLHPNFMFQLALDLFQCVYYILLDLYSVQAIQVFCQKYFLPGFNSIGAIGENVQHGQN